MDLFSRMGEKTWLASQPPTAYYRQSAGAAANFTLGSYWLLITANQAYPGPTSSLAELERMGLSTCVLGMNILVRPPLFPIWPL